ncbi:MAG: DegT/DnrJ/EryC1/StrS family aminotransferase [Candidatus Nomurabacteria bacterium]|nr:MAG: DegT/DnrJ/EryC1/StrS family aminotransferase [Candidatus Nomurabacteria bacterium]
MQSSNQQPIYVTKPALPPLEEFTAELKTIWENRVLTNNGPFHQQFELALAKHLDVPFVSVFSNGTLALMTALQSLDIQGEVITTPFSFVATTHALWWNKITPIFADIESTHFTLDPNKTEELITPQTSAIMPVHIYGYPCRTKEIDMIAKKHNLKVIYDAAHAFDVKQDGISVLNAGDLSVLSFHATKVFNTIEGGAIISHSEEMKNRIDHLKNFGFEDETIIIGPGINAKMNEVQAAYGLLQLKYVAKYIEARKRIVEKYRLALSDIPGLHFLEDQEGVQNNYAYFPIVIDTEHCIHTRDYIYEELKKDNIFSRRYFYPLISKIPLYENLATTKAAQLPVASKISEQVLCLPLYHDLSDSDFTRIISSLKRMLT